MGEPRLEKTKRDAARHPDTRFIAIDLKPYNGPTLAPNIKTRVADFKTGLGKQRHGTVDLIESELAFGHYGTRGRDPKEHTIETARVALRKLRKGGEFKFVVDGLMRTDVRKELIRAGFNPENVTFRRLTPHERQETPWTRKYQGFLYRVTAVK